MASIPLISIILPVYNIEKYLDRCFESLKRQSYQNLEIIFVDDGSTDNSGEKCESYKEKDSRIIVFHKVNGGLSDARNYGTARAKGAYITYVDPDDYIDEDYISYLYDLIVNYGTSMSVCQHRICYQNGKKKECSSSEKDEKVSSEQWLKRFLYNDIYDTSAYCKLIKRTLLTDISFPKGKIFEDLATMYKIIIKAKYIAVGYQSKYNYLFHSASISNDSFNERYFDYSDITDEVTSDIEKQYPELKNPAIAKRCRARFSVLNLMINTDADYLYPIKKKELLQYIEDHKKYILWNKNISKIEKTATIIISISYSIYRLGWKQHRRNIME